MNVYVILGTNYTKEKAIKEIKEEEYKHNFIFGIDIRDRQSKQYQMLVADEIWCFGDCTKTWDYDHSFCKGYDIWQMD